MGDGPPGAPGLPRCPVCGGLLPRGAAGAAAHVEACLGAAAGGGGRGGGVPGGGASPRRSPRKSAGRFQSSIGSFFGLPASVPGGGRKRGREGPSEGDAGGEGARLGSAAPSREQWKGAHAFAKVVEHGLEHGASLLAEDLEGVQRFRLCSLESRNLLLRLHLRKGPWFRTEKLKYAEVADIAGAVEELKAVGLVEVAAGSRAECEALLRLGTVEELRSLASAAFGGSRRLNGWKKDSLVSEILSLWDRPRNPFSKRRDSGGGGAIAGLLSSHLGRAVRISDSCSNFLRLLCLLYFLDDTQGVDTLVASEANALTFPSYDVGPPGEVFRDRQALLSYDRALECHREAWEAEAEGDAAALAVAVLESCRTLNISVPDDLFGGESVWLSGSESTDLQKLQEAVAGLCGGLEPSASSQERADQEILRRFRSTWPSAKTVGVGVKWLESLQCFGKAAALLVKLLRSGIHSSRRRRGKWWLRLSIDLAHCGLKEEAFSVCEAALNEPGAENLSPGEKVALQKRLLRLAKGSLSERLPEGLSQELSWEPPSETIVARPLDHFRQPSRKSVFFSCDGATGSVEDLALSHFASEEGGGWSGVHCESHLWRAIFGLVCWSVLYDDAPPGAFAHPYQSAPLDLRTTSFYSQRSDKLSKLLKQLENGEGPVILAAVWGEQSEHEPQVVGAPWGYALEDLQLFARAAGGRVLSKIVRNLASDWEGWKSGMPDIFLWRETSGGSTSGGLEGRFVEVKGPRDRLSEQQVAWLRDLEAEGAAVAVLRVREPNIRSECLI